MGGGGRDQKIIFFPGSASFWRSTLVTILVGKNAVLTAKSRKNVIFGHFRPILGQFSRCNTPPGARGVVGTKKLFFPRFRLILAVNFGNHFGGFNSRFDRQKSKKRDF